MSTYAATSRTNYFQVRDLETFRADLARHALPTTGWDAVETGSEFVLDAGPGDPTEGTDVRVALFSFGGWPDMSEDGLLMRLEDGQPCSGFEPLAEDGRRPGEPETFPEDQVPCDACHLPQSEHTADATWYESLSDLVAANLVDGDVAVFVEVGAEKMRFLGGHTVAVNARNERVVIDLEDIYQHAAHLGTTVTMAVN